MSAGALRTRVTFEAEINTSDGGGGNAVTWSTVATVWGQFRPERGRERLEAGRVEAAGAGVLRVRSSSTTEAITTEHRVTIAGTPWQIRAIANPDQRGRFLEMTLEEGGARGVAT